MNNQGGDLPAFPVGFLIGLIVFYVALIVFVTWAYVRIIRRAGYSGWWVLMALVPIGNLVMLGLFAFKEWPIQGELEYLRRHASMTGLPGYGQPPQGYAQLPPGYGPPPGHGQTPPGSGTAPDQGPPSGYEPPPGYGQADRPGDQP